LDKDGPSEFLQNNNVPHIVPVIKRGEQMKQILKGNKARSTQYVMKNPKKKHSFGHYH